MRAHDALHNRQRLLRRVAGFFAPVGRHHGVPPHIGRRFSARGFFRADKAGGEIRNSIHIFEIEYVIVGVFGEPINVVVLGRPARFAAPAEIVSPNNLVDAVFGPAENLFQQQAATRGFAPIDMKKQTAVGAQYPSRFDKPRTQKTLVIGERIVVTRFADNLAAIAATAESDSIRGFVVARAPHPQTFARLPPPGVKRRIDINERDRGGSHPPQMRQVVAGQNPTAAHPSYWQASQSGSSIAHAAAATAFRPPARVVYFSVEDAPSERK